MKVVKVRSPFTIEVNESGAIGSKVELFIYNKGTAIPATPTYILSKPNPSTTQLSTFYNVSNYVKEYIDNIKTNYVNYVGGVEENNEWVNFTIKRYKLVGSTYTLLDTTDYVGVNGFIDYTNGYQNPSNTVIDLLCNNNINNYYYSQSTYPTNTIQYFNLLIDKPTTSTTTITVKYERIDNTVYSTTISFGIGVSGIFNAKVPISLIKVDPNFINGCKVTITYTPVSGSATTKIFYTYPIEECKYTPVLCDFINRYGGWQTITFFKAQTNTINVKGSTYKMMPSAVNYNTSQAQTKSFNINGQQSIKLNTGWVDENYSDLITDLLLSETILLDGKPVELKTSSTDLKTSLKDKMINYEIEFDYAFNLINDVV